MGVRRCTSARQPQVDAGTGTPRTDPRDWRVLALGLHQEAANKTIGRRGIKLDGEGPIFPGRSARRIRADVSRISGQSIHRRRAAGWSPTELKGKLAMSSDGDKDKDKAERAASDRQSSKESSGKDRTNNKGEKSQSQLADKYASHEKVSPSDNPSPAHGPLADVNSVNYETHNNVSNENTNICTSSNPTGNNTDNSSSQNTWEKNEGVNSTTPSNPKDQLINEIMSAPHHATIAAASAAAGQVLQSNWASGMMLYDWARDSYERWKANERSRDHWQDR